MTPYIFSSLIGALCIFLGITNMRGNISTIHSYHRRNVSKEDIIPFGKLVGLGTIICGGSLLLFSILSIINYYTENPIYLTIGTVLLIAGLLVGLGFSFYAMIKYNKGIF